jgi:leucyl-tRNA synthetase
VKIFEDQWFIDYGNSEWKALARKCLEKMRILPEDLRTEFNYVIDWLHERACARKSGLGTRLPWDKDWIIESLSDSTIYMAYYTMARHIKEYGIQPNQLTLEVFDYIFLGKGDAAEISRKVGLNTEILEKMRSEFAYFYPLNSRHSGRDLVPNHLTFMIFNHVAVFPEELWPRQIVTNGSVTMMGIKMSKSFGNIIPLREALKMFGADPLRLSVLATAELLQDAEFSQAVAKSMQERIERLYRFVAEFSKEVGKTEKVPEKMLMTIDRWMLSRLQEHIKKATEFMEMLAVRKAIHIILYELEQDFQWYQKRIKDQKDNPERKTAINYVFGEVINAQIRMLAPVAPHICEELWEMIGGKGFVSLSSWPTVDETKLDVKAEENEALIMGLLEDTQNIIKATNIKPKKVFYYVAAPWKWKIYRMTLEKAVLGKVTQGDLMRELMKDSELKAKAKEVADFAGKFVEEINRMPTEKKQRLLEIGVFDEKQVLKDAEDFLKSEINAEIHVYEEENARSYDPKNRARLSKPLRPAIYVE